MDSGRSPHERSDMRGRYSRISLRSCGLQICAALSALRSGDLSLFGKLSEHALDKCRVAIFLDLFDLSVLDTPDHAILVVVTLPGPGDIIAAGFDHDMVA